MHDGLEDGGERRDPNASPYEDGVLRSVEVTCRTTKRTVNIDFHWFFKQVNSFCTIKGLNSLVDIFRQLDYLGVQLVMVPDGVEFSSLEYILSIGVDFLLLLILLLKEGVETV